MALFFVKPFHGVFKIPYHPSLNTLNCPRFFSELDSLHCQNTWQISLHYVCCYAGRMRCRPPATEATQILSENFESLSVRQYCHIQERGAPFTPPFPNARLPNLITLLLPLPRASTSEGWGLNLC